MAHRRLNRGPSVSTFKRCLGMEHNRVFLTPKALHIGDTDHDGKSPIIDTEVMSDLDLAIKNGWGNTKGDKLPPDWRTRKKGQKK